MGNSSWELLTDLYDRIEAEMVRAALEADGIPVVLSQEPAGNLYPVSFGELARIQVFVPQSCLDEARDWLTRYETGRISQTNNDDENED